MPGFWMEELLMWPPLSKTRVPLKPDPPPPFRVTPVTVVFFGGVVVQCAPGAQLTTHELLPARLAVAVAPEPDGALRVTLGATA